MSTSLSQRIHADIQAVLGAYAGAWLVWCDPRGDWSPLLAEVATDPKLGGFPLLTVDESTAGELGGPLLRRQLQERLDARESLVLLVRAPADRLGWLWAQALLAERIYARTLREQLLEWGWHPQSLTISDEELAAMARHYRAQDPHDWGGGGLQPDLTLLMRLLAGLDKPSDENRLVLEATIEATGLVPLDADQHLPLWRTRALAALLVTQAQQVAPEQVGEGHELLIPPAQRPAALQLLERWTDSYNLRSPLATAIIEADKQTALGALVATPAPDSLPFLSHAAEAAAFHRFCHDMASLSGKDLLEALAAHDAELERRAGLSFWSDDQKRPEAQTVPWQRAASLARAARRLLAASPPSEWATVDQAVSWYTQGGWRVDRAGEELLRPLPYPHPDLVALLGPLRAAYRHRWEGLLIRWSDLWTAAGCPLVNLPTAGGWLNGVLSAKSPAAVIVVDALRYDLGATIVERLQEQEGKERAGLAAARAPLPSITALGMGLALPLAEDSLEAELVGGAWQVHQKGQTADLSKAAERRLWWEEQGGAGGEALQRLADLTTTALPQPSATLKRLIIHDDMLDKLGHDDQLEELGTDLVLSRYLSTIDRLRDAGWRLILIVTDHGFIHWDGAAERQVAAPLPGALYTNRRALAYPAATELPLPAALAPGGHYRIALPSGAACFKTYGGLGYFHGGASLQEWIIPCLKIEWPARAEQITLEIVPQPRILSLRVKVKLRVVRTTLFLENLVGRRVGVVIRRSDTHAIIFRSSEMSINPERETTSIDLEPTKELAPRGTPVRLEVRDASTEEVIAHAESVLMVDKDEWATAPSDW